MSTLLRWLPLGAFAVALAAPLAASAQYKNSAFDLDAGYWMITKPSALDENGEVLPADRRPLRLSNGFRFGGETNFKMNDDHFWFTARVHGGFLQYGSGEATGDLDDQLEAQARDKIGTLFSVEGGMGIRYVILTDKFRPYLQGSLSYMRLFSFASTTDDTCTDELLCTGGGTYEENLLPHNDIGAVHFQPGVEMIFSRDIAVHLFADLQRWIVINAEDNMAIVLGLGFSFFT